MDLVAANARSKTAAWAWYQRTSGSVATCSHFKLEADLLLSDPPIQDSSGRLESLHLSTDSTNSSSDGAIDTSNKLMAPSTTSMQQINGHPRLCTDLVPTASSSYSAAAWDYGSTLFDSFKLVAMAKKLDDAHQLNHAIIEKVGLPAKGASADMRFETCLDADKVEEEEQCLGNHKLAALHTAALPHDTLSTQSRQAIYDMFCRYDNPVPPVEIFYEDASQCNHEHMRKPKPAMSSVARSKQYRRRCFHSFSKAFRQHIAQLDGHSRASSTAHRPPNKPCLSQSLSLPAEATAQLQR